MKIAIIGYGKMGKTIERLALEKGHEIVYKRTTSSNFGNIKDAQVAIEFSNPDAAVSNISECLETQIPVVCGTTGWLDKYSFIQKKCEECNGSFIYASNFSIGVNLFFQANEYLAKLMQPFKEYVPNMTEIHHTQKLDAPSGTAITLAEGILPYTEKSNWALKENATNNDVAIDAIREGTVKGTHIINYESKVDRISIQHEAHTRDGFALGALLAAEWLIDKKGVFTMKDVLGMTNDKL